MEYYGVSFGRLFKIYFSTFDVVLAPSSRQLETTDESGYGKRRLEASGGPLGASASSR